MDIAAAGEASGRHRAHEAFARAGGSQRSLEIVDVGRECRLANVRNRAGADRALALAPGDAASERGGIRIQIEFAELLPVATVGEAGEGDRAAARRLPRRARHRVGRGEAAQPRIGVVPPGAVIQGGAYRLAEFAVVGNVDAGRFLPTHDVGDGTAQRLGKRLHVDRRAA